MGIGRWATAGAAVLALGIASPVLDAAMAGAAGSSSSRAAVPTVISLDAPASHALRASAASASGDARRGPDPAQWVTPTPTVSPLTVRGSGRTDLLHATEQTLNWSGEMATSAGFTSVDGSWTVPSVSATESNTDSATWIGVGGGSRSATGLIQTGTDQHSIWGQTAYSAWYEILPTASVTIVNPTTGRPVPVSPGDDMQAEIVQQSASAWLIEIEDVTQRWTAHGTFTYTGTTATAEWIEEAPTLDTRIETLADFHSVHFTDMKDSAASGTSLVALQMVNGSNRVIAYPGTVRSTTTRDVTIYYGSPSTSTQSPPETPPSGSTPPKSTPPGGSTSPKPTTPKPTTPKPTTPKPTTPPKAPSSSGYDLVGSDGGVFVFDPRGTTGGYYGSLPGIHVTPAKPIVGMVATVDDKGYYLVGSDGGVFAFGDAPYLGSLPGEGVVPAAPITGIVAADTDHGYFLVGRDGGVFSFGSVPFLGSLPAEGEHVDDVVGIAATPSGNGYWLIASTGKVYAFGAAKQLGTVTSTTSAVSAIAGTATGGGYWVTTRNGSVHAFGNARDYGTLPALHVSPAEPVIGIVRTDGTGGYWLVASDGGVFTFGDAPFIGALPSIAHVSDIVGAVATNV